jgi:hypothetical protein
MAARRGVSLKPTARDPDRSSGRSGGRPCLRPWARSFIAGFWLFVSGCEAAVTLSSPQPPEPEVGHTETLVRGYSKPCPQVWEAAQAAVASLGMSVLRSVSQGPGGILSARRADDHPLDVDVAQIDPAHSQVTVRVRQGDRDLAWLVQQEILSRMGPG